MLPGMIDSVGAVVEGQMSEARGSRGAAQVWVRPLLWRKGRSEGEKRATG